jgi:hypothetical protein
LIAARHWAHYDAAEGSPKDLRAGFISEGPAIMDTVIERAVARGELAAAPPARIVTLPVDLVRHEMFMTMAAVPVQTITEIVDDVFLPLATNFGRDQR